MSDAAAGKGQMCRKKGQGSRESDGSYQCFLHLPIPSDLKMLLVLTKGRPLN